MSNTDQQIEQEIQSKGLTAPRLTPGFIDSKIALEMYFTGAGIINAQTLSQHLGLVRVQHHDGEDLHKPMETLTFCVLVLENGFTVTGESACASPENFDAEIGRKIAFENARNKIWQLEGYLLKQSLYADKVMKEPFVPEQKQPISLKEGIDTLMATRIPVLDQIYDVCQAIEKCGASPELTEAVTKAGQLRAPITELVKQAVALGIGEGIVAVSYSNEANMSADLAASTDSELFGEIKPSEPEPTCEPSVNNLRCSGSVGESTSSARDKRLDNRETAYMLTQLVNSKEISSDLRKKAEDKLSTFLDKLI